MVKNMMKVQQRCPKKAVNRKKQQKTVGNPKQVVSYTKTGKANQEVSKLVTGVSNINFGLL